MHLLRPRDERHWLALMPLPVFHQKDKYTTAHIHLGLMAYQIVAAIRHRLKQPACRLPAGKAGSGWHDIYSDWSDIVRIMNSQKMITIEMKMRTKEVHIRKASSPEKQVKHIYNIMGIKQFPKPIKKYVMYH